MIFFAKVVHNKLASPQAAKLSIHFFPGKSVVRDLIKDTPLIDREKNTEKEIEEKKALHPAGFEPTISLSRGLCSTPALVNNLIILVLHFCASETGVT